MIDPQCFLNRISGGFKRSIPIDSVGNVLVRAESIRSGKHEEKVVASSRKFRKQAVKKEKVYQKFVSDVLTGKRDLDFSDPSLFDKGFKKTTSVSGVAGLASLLLLVFLAVVDISGAYYHLSVRTQDLVYNNILLFKPESYGGPSYMCLTYLVNLFGGRWSVANWCRTSDFLCGVLSAVLELQVYHYIDDLNLTFACPTLELAKKVLESLCCIISATGLTYKRSKAAVGTCIELLGVLFSFSEKSVSLSITTKRVDSILGWIAAIKKSGMDSFDPAQASSLLGRCQFIFTALGCNLYPLIRPLAFFSAGGAISHISLEICLTGIEAILRNLPTREVLFELPSHCLNTLVYTDASFASGKGRMGGVLIHKGIYYLFTFIVTESMLMYPYSEWPINFLEVMACPLAVSVFSKWICNSFVYMLVDNTSAEYALIKKCSRSYALSLGSILMSETCIRHGTSYWASRVSTHSNIADCTTRSELLKRLLHWLPRTQVIEVSISLEFWIREHLKMSSPLARKLAESYFQTGYFKESKDPMLEKTVDFKKLDIV